jgi:putative nucleotidyltransferase with HDIG domain
MKGPNFSEALKENPVFEMVAKAARTLGLPTYVVGGYVRDLLMGKVASEADFVCLGSGIALCEELVKQSPEFSPPVVFKNFGTAMTKLENTTLEFVGARKESYSRNSRKPMVEDGSLEDDQKRRDFTINALSISLNQEDYGELYDPFGGISDMAQKIIKTPLDPNVTFSDDPLRMMRAIRFASKLNFDIDPDTFEAIAQNKERIKIVSAERITEELNKIILSQTPSYGFKLLFHAGILELIFPEFVLLRGAEAVGDRSHKDNFYHTLQVLDNLSRSTDNLWERWAALLHDIAKPATKRYDPKVGWTFHGHEERGAKMVPEIFRKFKLPLNEKMRMVQKLVRLHLRPIALVKDEVTDSAVRRLLFEAGEDFEALMRLCRADVTTKALQRAQKYLRNFDKVENRVKELEVKDRIRTFQPVVSGEIIMETFGLKPSREVGLIKESLREAILEGKIPNEYQPCMDFVLQKAAQMGIKPKP